MPRLQILAGWLLGLGVSGAAVWLLFNLVPVDAAASALAAAQPLALLAVAPVLVLQLALRTLRWRVLLAVASPPTTPAIRRLARILLIGYLANAVLPARLGEPIRAYLAARQLRIDVAESFGVVILERVLDTASLAWLAAVAASLAGAPGWLVQALIVVAVAAAGVVALLVSGLIVQLASALDGAASRRPRVLAVPARLVHRIARGVDGAGRIRAVGAALGVSLACWGLDATTFWLVGHSLGVDLRIQDAVLIAAVTVLGTILPSAPGYLGTFELAATATAAALGVAPAPALALAVLAHAITLLPLALGGAMALAASGSALDLLASQAAAAGQEASAVGASPADSVRP